MVFIVTLFTVRMLGALFRKGAEVSMMGGVDRLFGFFFGVAEGVVLLLVVMTVALVSPQSERFHEWILEGKISPNFAVHAEGLSSTTREVTADLRIVLIQQLQNWGVPGPMLERICADPELVNELLKHTATKPYPEVVASPRPAFYTRLFQLLSDKGMQTTEKAKQIWDVIQNERDPVSSPPNAP